jgi:hypothetical protein
MWSTDFRFAVQEQLFRLNNGAGLYDAIYEATGRSLNDTELRNFVTNLPEELLCLALQWSMSDTQFRDDVFRCLKLGKIDITGASTRQRF